MYITVGETSGNFKKYTCTFILCIFQKTCFFKVLKWSNKRLEIYTFLYMAHFKYTTSFVPCLIMTHLLVFKEFHIVHRLFSKNVTSTWDVVLYSGNWWMSIVHLVFEMTLFTKQCFEPQKGNGFKITINLWCICLHCLRWMYYKYIFNAYNHNL